MVWNRCAIFCSIVLVGCSAAPPAPEPIVRTVEVPVQVPVKCVKDRPARPAIMTLAQILDMPSAGAAVRILGIQHEKLRAYADEMDAVIAPCLVDPQSPGAAERN